MNISLGGRYKDEQGRVYTVSALVGDLIKITYIDITEELITREKHFKAMRQKEREDQERARKQGIESRFVSRQCDAVDVYLDPFTLGFLAGRVWIYAQFPAPYENTFVDDHIRTTGVRPDSEHYHITDNPKDWNALSTTIEFPYHEDLDFGDLEVYDVKDVNRGRIYSNAYFWALLLKGFRLGRWQDIERIMGRIVHRAARRDFNRGLKEGRLQHGNYPKKVSV